MRRSGTPASASLTCCRGSPRTSPASSPSPPARSSSPPAASRSTGRSSKTQIGDNADQERCVLASLNCSRLPFNSGFLLVRKWALLYLRCKFACFMLMVKNQEVRYLGHNIVDLIYLMTTRLVVMVIGWFANFGCPCTSSSGRCPVLPTTTAAPPPLSCRPAARFRAPWPPPRPPLASRRRPSLLPARLKRSVLQLHPPRLAATHTVAHARLLPGFSTARHPPPVNLSYDFESLLL